MKTIRCLVSLGALGALTLTVFTGADANGAAINWGPATGIAGDADIDTDGSLVVAYSLGNSTSPVVNGVTFTHKGYSAAGITPGTSPVADSGAGVFSSGSNPFHGLSANYQNLLSAASYTTAGPPTPNTFTLTLSGLTIGHVYEFQWWVNDPRDPIYAGRLTTATAGNSVTLNNQAPAGSGDVGQFAIGTFTADGASEVINFSGASSNNPYAQINAYQLRDITASDVTNINWGPATGIAGDTDVVTNGFLVKAYNIGNTSGGSVTVNGVTFTNSSYAYVGLAGLNGTHLADYAAFGSGSNPFVSLSANYQTLLGSAAYTNGGSGTYPFTLTLTGLTSGHTYEFQWWTNDSRDPAYAGRMATATAGTSVTLNNQTPAGAGHVGQFAIGTFIADGTGEEVITFNGQSSANPYASINAYQLRDITVFPVTKIVYPAGDAANQAAANKLATVLALMNGTTLPVAAYSGPPSGTAYIHVGKVGNMPASMTTWLNAQNPYAGAVEEMTDYNGNVWIAGPSDLATWWAVGDWLHQLGFYWFVPSTQGMQYPTGLSYTFHYSQPRQYVSPFIYRGAPWQANNTDLFGDWCVLNGLDYPNNPNLYSPQTYGALPPFNGFGETESNWLTAANLAAHPTYFASVNGVPLLDVNSNPTHFEYADSTEGALTTWVLPTALTWLQSQSPQGLIYLFAPSDEENFSKSPAAQALGNVSNNVFTFVQELADKITVSYPNCQTMCYAYDAYPAPPTNISLKSNVLVMLTLWDSLGYTNYYGPSMDPSSTTGNPTFCSTYAAWKSAAPGGLWAYPYWGDYDSFTPYPQNHIINYDLQAWQGQGLKGVYAESHPHWGTNAMSLYTMARNLWDTTESETAMRSEFCSGYWGAASSIMLAFENYQLASFGYDSSGNNKGITRGAMTPAVITAGNSYMSQAATALAGSPSQYQWRYNLASAAWSNSVTWAQAMASITQIEEVNQWNYSYTPTQLQQMLAGNAASLSSVLTFAGTTTGLWAFDYPTVQIIVNSALNGIQLNPASLPTGASTYNESFNCGEPPDGTPRIFANSISNTWTVGPTTSPWGLSLGPNQSGQITYLFKPATAGVVLQNAQLQGLSMYNAGLVSDSVQVSTDNVHWTTVAANTNLVGAYIDLTSYVAGASQYWVKFQAVHDSSALSLVLDNCNFYNVTH